MQGLVVSPSPHIRKPNSTQKIMLTVIIALLPSAVASVILFGLRALLVLLTSVCTAVAWEILARLIMKRNVTITDLSSVVTGLIFALNLPATLPLYMVALGTFVAIVIVKQLFGGLGQNFANPAITARIVLVVSFGSQMTNWVKPFYYKDGVDLATYATPLVSAEKTSYLDMFLGNHGGSMGETCALALLIGLIILLARKIITPTIPFSYIGSLALLSIIVGKDPLFEIMAGGVLIGAIFMATDYVTSPQTEKGKLIFGLGCGFITFAIRQWGALPEGTSFSILIMNIITPYIDMFTKTKPVGAKKKEVAE